MVAVLKIRKREYPLEEEGRVNRMESNQTNMTAKMDTSKGQYFILHDVLYQAIRAIPKGSEVKPNDNCVIKQLNELGGN